MRPGSIRPSAQGRPFVVGFLRPLRKPVRREPCVTSKPVADRHRTTAIKHHTDARLPPLYEQSEAVLRNLYIIFIEQFLKFEFILKI